MKVESRTADDRRTSGQPRTLSSGVQAAEVVAEVGAEPASADSPAAEAD